MSHPGAEVVVLEGDGLVVDPALQGLCLVQRDASIVGELDGFPGSDRGEKVAGAGKMMHGAAIPNQWWVVRPKLVDQSKGDVAFQAPGVDVVVGKVLDGKVAGEVGGWAKTHFDLGL